MTRIFFPRRFNILRRKIRAMWGIFRAKEVLKTIYIASDIEAVDLIFQTLQKKISPQSLRNLDLNSVAEEILCVLKNPQERSTEALIDELLDGAFRQTHRNLVHLAGLTTAWEFRVRILANKIGISSNVPIELKSRKNKATKSVEHKSLSTVIKEFNVKTGQRSKLKLLELSELRNSIVHCNPHGIKTYAIPMFGKGVLKPIRGNVVVISTSDGSVKNIGDLSTEDEIENLDVFGWFLEIFNSKLPRLAFAEFEQSMRVLDTLIEFAAISFGARKAVFDKIIFQGYFPSQEDINLYREYFDSRHGRAKPDVTKYFAVMTSAFNLKKGE